jgi:type I restriction enzyme S subunit
MQTYSRMKDSGVEWVGPIPDTWTVFPAATVFSEIKEKNGDGSRTNPLSFRYGEIVAKNIVGNIDEDLEKTLSAYRMVSPDTIMINGLNLNYDFITQRVAIVNQHGIITSAYIAVQPDESKLLPRFALYLLKAYDYRQVFHGIGSGIRKTLKFADFRQIKITAPPIGMQKQIVLFLDSACADIDTAIAEAKASIDEYKLLKQSVITQAVTKGLDPNVPMKDSGVEWIGEIPEHWGIAKIASLYSLRNDRVSDKEYPPLSVTMHGILPQLGTAAKTDDGDNRRLVRIGDFVINSRSDRRGSCGISPYDGSVSLINTAMTPRRKMNAGYFNWLFHTSQFADEFYKWGHGIVDDLWTTRWQEMKKILVPVPQLPDQEHIRAYLDSTCADIDAMISEKQSTIADLESYKKSLIYEVVTGKRKVV